MSTQEQSNPGAGRVRRSKRSRLPMYVGAALCLLTVALLLHLPEAVIVPLSGVYTVLVVVELFRD